MIYQTDPAFPPSIFHWGCYFMALNERLSTLFGLPFTVESVLGILGYASGAKLIDSEVTLLDPQALADYVEPNRVHFKGKFEAGYPTAADEFEIVCYHKDGASFNHFCSGNGKGIVIYDPWSEQGSDSVRNGSLIGKRIFKIL
jgi:hypothetical protein